MSRVIQEGAVYGGVFHRTVIDGDGLEWLRAFIDAHPQTTLRIIASAACEKFEWRRPNGEVPTHSCGVLLRRLEKRGLLVLPRPPRAVGVGGVRAPHTGTDLENLLEAVGPIPGMVECQPSGPLTVRPIAKEEWLGFRLHMRRYHYLGFDKPVGESLCYAALLGAELVALMMWGAAVLHNGPRDEYLGWDSTTKARRLLWVVNNRRFLVLPWVRLPHLASRVLAANLRRLSQDWEHAYKHPVFLAETFIDSSRFRGTCYRASNWLYLGETKGFSRTKAGFSPNQRPKAVFVYPLHRHARLLLSDQRPS